MDSKQACYRSGLVVAALLAAACDPSGAGTNGSSGAGGSGAAGAGGSGSQPRPALLSPNHYQVLAPSSLGSGGQGGGSGVAPPGAGATSGGASASSGGAAGSGGAAPAALSCVFIGPSGSPRNVCGDGFLNGSEQCDDGNTANGDACGATCGVTPTLIAPHAAAGASGALPFPGRELGLSGHAAAVGCNTVGVAFLDRAPTPAALELALFSSVGQAQGVVELGGATIDSPNPAIAALPDDSFVAVWTAFDSDELGIRLRQVRAGAALPAPAVFANVEQGFSQRAPDVVFDGSELVVAWVDDSDPLTAPDLRFRTFAPDLSPTSDEQTLAATGAVEDQVTLAAFNGHWAAAWRAGSAGSETIEVQSGTTHWSVGPFLPGASADRPALTFVDATHLALAFTEGTDPLASGVASVPRLHAAVLDRAYPGHTESFAVEPTVAPYLSSPELGQSQPSIVSFADRLVVGWRSGSLIGDPAGDELWSRELKWSPGPSNTLIIDTSAIEKPLLAEGALRAGDQAKLSLLTSSNWPDHRLLSVWEEDSHRVLGNTSGLPDVLLQFSQVPGELAAPAPGPCVGVTLAVSPAEPAVDFSSVTLTAAATCGGGAEAEYQFGYQAPGSTVLTFIRSWGPATVNWSTAGLPSGRYTLYAYARRKGTSVAFDSYTALGYLVGKVCNASPSFGIAPTGVRPVGTVFSLSAGATCTLSGTPEYRFMYQLPGSSTWVDVGTWSTTPVSWNTAGLPSGNYTFLAYVRAAGNASSRESYVYGSTLLGNVCYSVNSVTGSPASPQGVGATIALSATATCVGAATPEFLYYYYPPSGGAATQIGTWSAAPVNWNTTGLPPGKFALLAFARAVGNQSSQESSGYGSFQLGTICTSVTMSASPTGTQPIGTSVTVTGNAGCNPAEYLFTYRVWGSSTWFTFRDWLSTSTATWGTTGLASGAYEVRTDVRFAGHTGTEATTQINYLIGNVCTGAVVSVSPASPATIGTPITLSGSANCNGGASAEYQFYAQAPGSSARILLRDWGPASFSWSTTSLAPGAYALFAYARAAGNTDAYESVGVTSLTLQAGP